MCPNEDRPIPVDLTDLDAVRAGKIQAIKHLRAVTGWGLKETKDIVEAIYEGCSNSTCSSTESALKQQLADMTANRDYYVNLYKDTNNTVSDLQDKNDRLKDMLKAMIDSL